MKTLQNKKTHNATKAVKRLSLRTEIIRTLTYAQLKIIEGGVQTTGEQTSGEIQSQKPPGGQPTTCG